MEFHPEGIFGSNRGLHVEFENKTDAIAFYQHNLELGNPVEIHGCMVIALNSKQYSQNQKRHDSDN